MSERMEEGTQVVKAGRELDALVSERVMGDAVTWLPTALQFRVPHYLNSELGSGYLVLPRYSADIAAAWKVLQKMRERFDFTAPLWDARLAHIVTLSAPEAAEEICRAALRVVEVYAPSSQTAGPTDG